MSLNCLTCQVLQRTDSEREYLPEKPKKKVFKVERNWSGNITPPPSPLDSIGGVVGGVVSASTLKGHRRFSSTGAIMFKENCEPKLVRSSGMRRDWSFEDLERRTAAKRIDDYRTS
ncbi:hypothetical protein K2173_002886 [Erythroxylum novogranatense]|uniref:Uncharacterized protein n=1 Tax=Erythroxylum novogranatense TaxID=1862640 RepID=A0AAV8SQB4_9ROSI|nr:hypothetical protein K2173_002886 [Erythroxylum novogranatense]